LSSQKKKTAEIKLREETLTGAAIALNLKDTNSALVTHSLFGDERNHGVIFTPRHTFDRSGKLPTKTSPCELMKILANYLVSIFNGLTRFLDIVQWIPSIDAWCYQRSRKPRTRMLLRDAWGSGLDYRFDVN
jgi:hypothetical protein